MGITVFNLKTVGRILRDITCHFRESFDHSNSKQMLVAPNPWKAINESLLESYPDGPREEYGIGFRWN